MDTSNPTRQYGRFGAMIATSTVLMFLLTYTNTYAWDHVRWSEERVYMALLMGGAMAVVMLGFMWQMHPNAKVNVAIVVAGLLVMSGALWLSRSQHFVDDREYMGHRGVRPARRGDSRLGIPLSLYANHSQYNSGSATERCRRSFAAAIADVIVRSLSSERHFAAGLSQE